MSTSARTERRLPGWARAVLLVAAFVGVFMLLFPVRGDARGDFSVVGLPVPWQGAGWPLAVAAAVTLALWWLTRPRPR